MWRKKVKHKKLQFFLTGLLLCVTAAVFCTCVCFCLELKSYAQRRFSVETCPDAYAYSVGSADLEENIPDSEVRENIKETSVLSGRNISVPLKHGKTNLSSITNMACVIEDKTFWDYMEFLEGEKKETPGDGEVWIPKTMAVSYHIELGDEMILCYEKPVSLRVSGIYAATFAPSERLTIMADIVNKKTLSALPGEEETGILAFWLKDNSKEELAKLAMCNPYALITFDRQGLQEYITKISGVVGTVSAAAAGMLFLAALFIIRFIIQNDLKKEMYLIGVYKSLGYTHKKIEAFYGSGYLWVGSVSIVTGIIASLPIVFILGSQITRVLGSFSFSAGTVGCGIGVFIILLLLLYGGVWISLRKIRKITPVMAISAKNTAGGERVPHSLLKHAKSPFATQANQVWKHKKSSMVTFLVLTVSIYLILFFSSGYFTCSHIYENINRWIACPKSDAVISGNLTQEDMEKIEENPYVKYMVSGNCFYYPSVTLPQYDGNSRSIDFFVLSDIAEEKTGIHIKEGYVPKRAEEAAVSEMLLKKLGLKTGDYLRIEEGKVTQDFLITGSFSTMETDTILLNIEAMQGIEPSYHPAISFVTLKKQTEFSGFKKSIEKEFPELSVDKEWNALKAACLAIESMLSNIMLVMLLVFVLFAMIAIVNVLVLTMQEKRRQYGILKSLGFTNGYLVRQNICYVFLLSGTAGLAAFLLHRCFSKKLFAMIVLDAMEDSVLLTGGLLGGTAILILAVSLLSGVIIRKIMPVNLMEE